MSAERPTLPPPGRSAWSVAVGIDDGREPWAGTIAAGEFPTRARARQWVEQTIRSPRARVRLRQTQGEDGNRPLLVATLEQVYYRPVGFTDPDGGLVEDLDREPVDDTQATAFLRADRATVVWDDAPAVRSPEQPRRRGGGGRER
jgi:hypothetical protein